MRSYARLGAILFSIAFSPRLALAQKTYPGCGPLADTDFKLTTLVSRTTANQLEEPVKMTLDMDAQGRIDIYFVQRYGKVRKLDIATRELTTLGTIPVDVKLEDGLTGIILDPGFKSNRWMYIYYATGTTSDFRFRLSRFHLDGAGMLDLASEKPLLVIPAGKGKSHTGGSMRFDPQGVLYIGIGENDGGELSGGNTNDLRGKILRIKPIPFADTQKPAPGPGSTYTIPEGNLFQATDKTRPEIYVMGNRNPYTLELDNATGRLAWGDVGPNGTDSTEEHDVTAKPGNFGYPYYAGNQKVVTPNTGTPAKPINANPGNTGLRELPPAIPAANYYLRNASITGPIYRYNDAPANSTVKFPPQFDGMWFVTDFNSGFMDTIQLDGTGLKKSGMGRVFKNWKLEAPLDFQQGPDGALYAVNYGGYFNSTAATALVRLEYSGTCRPAPVSAMRRFPGLRDAPIRVEGFTLTIGEAGAYRVEVVDTRGRVVAAFRGRGEGRYDLSTMLRERPGVYSVRLETAAGSRSRALLFPR